MASLEKATNDMRPRGVYPVEWGAPPADPEARTAWARAAIERGRYQRNQGEDVPWLAATTTPADARARLEALRDGPVEDEHEARRRHLEAKRAR